MICNFQNLSNNSKLWIFPSSRKFYSNEMEHLTEEVEQFLSQFISHNAIIHCGFEIRYDRFIIIAIDLNDTNLSIEEHDKLVFFIQQLEKKYDVLLLDKINVCFKQGEYVQYKEMKDFKKLIKEKSISNKTLVFDNLIDLKGDLDNNWEIPITESWLGRFL